VVVPGYGMAVAQAQHAVAELGNILKERGVDVKYAIHPVAGRMPGHMNVLLAEANVPYEQLHEMEAINPYFPAADIALVVGANDWAAGPARAARHARLRGPGRDGRQERRGTARGRRRTAGRGLLGAGLRPEGHPEGQILQGYARAGDHELPRALRASRADDRGLHGVDDGQARPPPARDGGGTGRGCDRDRGRREGDHRRAGGDHRAALELAHGALAARWGALPGCRTR